MAANRSQRSNAGNRMSRLIDEEADEDEFYDTAFGGFQEESGDEKYDTEDSEADISDSDIDASEKSELDVSSDESQPRKKRKKIVIPAVTRDKEKITKGSQKREREVVASIGATDPDESSNRIVRKSKRSSTIVQSQEFQKRMKDRDGKEGKQLVKKSQNSTPLTQEELLEEAKETEKANLASLRAYQQSEKEKRATKVIRRKQLYPFIRYQSLTMPDVEIQPENGNAIATQAILNSDEQSINHIVVAADNNHDHNYNKKCDKKEHNITLTSTKKYARNFLTFPDPSQDASVSFPTATLATEPKPVSCPVTNLPARYVDPATLIPYATIDAFQMIREAAQACANTIKEETKEVQPVIASLHAGAQ